MPSLNWIGKDAVEHHHKEVPYKLINCDADLSCGNPDAGNLLIQGDNLEALKSLLPYYGGQVKCIYIDPPYNTGQEGWIYNDNVSSPEIKAWLGRVVGRESEDLSRHDKWLCMMYPRIRLLRDLMHEEGVIFVSIDDNEVSNCKELLRDIFGTHNFVSHIIWKKMDSPSSNVGERIFSDYHDHIICFAKNKSKAALQQLPAPDILNAYPVVHNGQRARWRQLRKNGKSARREDRPNSWFPMEDPDGNDVWPIHPKEGWEGRWSIGPDTWEKIKHSDEVKWEKRKSGWVPYRLETAPDIPTMPTSTILEDVGQNRQAKAQLNQILGTNHGFETPKPYDMVERLISLVSDQNCLVLDSFCGSGTTGHATLSLNNKDGGNRRFILIEMQENIATSIAAERLRRVSQGFRPQSKANEIVYQRKITLADFRKSAKVLEEVDEIREEKRTEYDEVKATIEDGVLTLIGSRGTEEDLPGLGGGFRFCRLGLPLFNEFGDIDGEVSFPDLAAHVFFAETGAPIPTKAQVGKSYLGKYGDRAVYLLFAQGEQGTPREAIGNVLTPSALAGLPPAPEGFDGTRVVYAEGTTVSPHRLKAENVVFKQIPYQIAGV